MNKIYEQLKDLHVRKVVVYANSEDSKLYVDAKFEKQIKKAELEELFRKGMLLINSDEGVFEEAIKVANGKAYTMGTSSSAVAFVEWSAE